MKGYGILLPGGELCHDHETGRPYFVKTKRTAFRAVEQTLPDWLRDGARVVPVTLESGLNGDTYILGSVVNRERDRSTGRYTYENRWERLCTCGHTLGHHTAEAPHVCIEPDFSDIECACERFTPAKRSS